MPEAGAGQGAAVATGANPGMGAGGTGGQGRGSSPPGEAPEGPTGNSPEQLTGQKHQGKMIGSFLEKGEAPAGEAQLAVEEAIRASQRLAEESLEKERIPAELREVAREYFERLNRRAQGGD